jgi:hypothetical protein
MVETKTNKKVQSLAFLKGGLNGGGYKNTNSIFLSFAE